MAIRKYGAVTGQVTGIDQDGIGREAARTSERDAPWTSSDEQDLEAENKAADGPRDDG